MKTSMAHWQDFSEMKLKTWYRIILLALCATCMAFLSGCASSRGGTVNFATEGPELFVIGEYKGKELQGSLERKVLIGLGSMTLNATGKGGFTCTAKFNSPPQPNLRVRGVLLCEGFEPLGVTINPLGPDQGLGVARQAEDEDLMVFFFHPSEEEARLRFPQVKKQIEEARAR